MNITTLNKEDGLIARVIRVEESRSGKYLRMTEVPDGNQVCAVLPNGSDVKLAEALLGESATVVTDLPEVNEAMHGWIEAGSYSRSVHATAKEVLDNAKALLAIHAELVKREDAREALELAKRAEEEAAAELAAARRAKRREELAEKFNPRVAYKDLGTSGKTAIEYIIDLEEAAKV